MPLDICSYLILSQNEQTSALKPSERRFEKIMMWAQRPKEYEQKKGEYLTPAIIGQFGEWMLKIACICPNVNLVRALLENKVDPNKNEHSAIPALLCAAMSGSMPIFALLITHGASLNNSYYSTTILPRQLNSYDLCLTEGHYALAIYLDRYFPNAILASEDMETSLDSLHVAIYLQNTVAMKELLNNFGVIPQSKHLRLALALKSRALLFPPLLEKTSDVQLNTPEFLKLLPFCVQRNFLVEAELLLERKVNTNIIYEGKPLLFWAAQTGNEMRALLERYLSDEARAIESLTFPAPLS